jgi:hypothetical protein
VHFDSGHIIFFLAWIEATTTDVRIS